MKFFLDANLNIRLAVPLRALFIPHEFVTARDVGLQDCDDIPLFPEVAKLGFRYFMTHDVSQLRRSDERRALWESGLHWIGWKDPGQPGFGGLAIDAATVTASLPLVLADSPREPMCYQLTGIALERKQRMRCSPIARDEWKNTS